MLMPTKTAAQVEIPLAYTSPASGWLRLSAGSYADPQMLLGADDNPLTNISIYRAHMAAQRLGLRLTDDIEHNELVNKNPNVANQMRNYAVWTSILRDVESTGSGYTAKHIARPEVSIVDGGYVAKGRTKAIKLPKDGFFKIRELLESDTGLPTKTYGDNLLDEPCAYWIAAAGKERPVFRGVWYLYERREFSAAANWGQFHSYTNVGARGASDSEPSAIVLARAEALARLDGISRRHGITDDSLLQALSRS